MKDLIQERALGIDIQAKITKLVLELHDLARIMSLVYSDPTHSYRVRKVADEMSDVERDCKHAQ